MEIFKGWLGQWEIPPYLGRFFCQSSSGRDGFGFWVLGLVMTTLTVKCLLGDLLVIIISLIEKIWSIALTRVVRHWANKKQSQAGKADLKAEKAWIFFPHKMDWGNFISMVVMLGSVDLFYKTHTHRDQQNKCLMKGFSHLLKKIKGSYSSTVG